MNVFKLQALGLVAETEKTAYTPVKTDGINVKI